jgi:hypothetical protein
VDQPDDLARGVDERRAGVAGRAAEAGEEGIPQPRQRLAATDAVEPHPLPSRLARVPFEVEDRPRDLAAPDERERIDRNRGVEQQDRLIGALVGGRDRGDAGRARGEAHLEILRLPIDAVTRGQHDVGADGQDARATDRLDPDAGRVQRPADRRRDRHEGRGRRGRAPAEERQGDRRCRTGRHTPRRTILSEA